MPRRRWPIRLLTLMAVTLFSAVFVLSYAQQVTKDAKTSAVGAAPETLKDGEAIVPHERTKEATGLENLERIQSEIEQYFATYDLKPRPLPPIPDNPPPHQGNLFAIPLVVDTPDLLVVEVLEALPGRPIGGERLIRPDGTISLGFYGDINVRGLTIEQVKVAVIKHLRRFIQDETLGLVTDRSEQDDRAPALATEKKTRGFPSPMPTVPNERSNLLRDEPDEKKKRNDADDVAPEAKPKRISRPAFPNRTKRPVRLIAGSAVTKGTAPDQEEPKPAEEIKVPVGGNGQVKITIEVQANAKDQAATTQAEEQSWEPTSTSFCKPQDSLHVFVDVTAFNSRHYFVLGDVMITGRLPWTGNETVLDAINYAGGLLPTADPKDIQLVRPGSNGRPSKVFKVDLEAIRDRGEPKANYQLFPDDRLVIGRSAIVKKTAEFERLAAPIDIVSSTITRSASAVRNAQTANPEKAAALLKDAIDTWVKAIKQSGDVQLDEESFRKLLLQSLQSPAPAK